MYETTTLPFSRNRVLQLLLAAYAIFWVAMALYPTDRFQWLMENLLPVATVIAVCWTYRKFQFSGLSYVLIFAFLFLHTYAAHYTYENTPFDQWLKSAFHTRRSYFDRVVHFAFGLLLAYPFREALVRLAGLRGSWSYLIPAAAILTCSAWFEIMEAIVAMLSGQLGTQYMGMQGDVYDSEKDMASSLVGVVISLGGLALLHKRKAKETG